MLIFDIETDGLLDTVSRLFCLSIYDTETDKLVAYGIDEVDKGVQRLRAADAICGHNIINYDIPALDKLCGFDVTGKDVFDTLVVARLIYTNLGTTDLGRMKKGTLPKKYYKSHTLAAYGYRLGVLKGTYGQQEDAWHEYNLAMLEYNKQDVIVTKALYEKLLSYNYSQQAIKLEHEVAFLMAQQERNGFRFDYQGAIHLMAKLKQREQELTQELLERVPELPDKIFVPKRDNKAKGYKAGVPIQRYKPFNPTSRQQVEYVLKNIYHYVTDNADMYNVPEGFKGDISTLPLKMDDDTFNLILADDNCSDELKAFVKDIAELFMLSKRLGQISEGKQAWLSAYNENTGCIHGRVITNGAVSGRATHSNPNIAQVPAINVPYGKECRALFCAGDWWQAGIDASGLELRCLAHYMFPYDKGAYAHEILNGDIHTANQKAAGLAKRSDAKRFIYAYL